MSKTSNAPSQLHSRFTYSTAVSNAVYCSLIGSFYGGVWGAFTPFHAPGSAGAIAESKSGIFRPARPFSSFSSVGHSAAIFGSIACVQQLSSKSLAFLRQNDDFLNDIAGFGVAYKYYSYFLGSSEKRLILHNRAFGGIVLGAVLYGHIVV